MILDSSVYLALFLFLSVYVFGFGCATLCHIVPPGSLPSILAFQDLARWAMWAMWAVSDASCVLQHFVLRNIVYNCLYAVFNCCFAHLTGFRILSHPLLSFTVAWWFRGEMGETSLDSSSTVATRRGGDSEWTRVKEMELEELLHRDGPSTSTQTSTTNTRSQAACHKHPWATEKPHAWSILKRSCWVANPS